MLTKHKTTLSLLKSLETNAQLSGTKFNIISTLWMNVFQTGGKYDIRLNKPFENLKILTGYVCCETRALPADNPIHFTFHRLPAMCSVYPFIGEQQLGDTVVPREQNSVTRPPHQSASRRAKRRHPTSTWRGKGVTSLNGDILFTVGQMRG